MVERERPAVQSIVSGMSLTTARLIERLRQGQVGDTVSDEELTELCGRNTRPDGDGYNNLLSAIRYVTRNHGVVWERQVGENYLKALDSTERLSLVERRRKHVHRTSRRAGLELPSPNADDLTYEQRSEVLVKDAMLRCMIVGSSAKLQQRLSERPEVVGDTVESALNRLLPRHRQEENEVESEEEEGA
jgi:hypothetical protein